MNVLVAFEAGLGGRLLFGAIAVVCGVLIIGLRRWLAPRTQTNLGVTGPAARKVEHGLVGLGAVTIVVGVAVAAGFGI